MTPVLRRRYRYPQRMRLYNTLIPLLVCVAVIGGAAFIVWMVSEACCGWR